MAEKMHLNEDFFRRKADVVAKELLGAKINGKYVIVETEAYRQTDKDDNGKFICYGVNKETGVVSKTSVTTPLFNVPGTWCIYHGQLLISVKSEDVADNVLIKKIMVGKEVYGPDKIAQVLRLYKKYSDYANCSGCYSLTCKKVKLQNGSVNNKTIMKSRRVRIESDEKLNFSIV